MRIRIYIYVLEPTNNKSNNRIETLLANNRLYTAYESNLKYLVVRVKKSSVAHQIKYSPVGVFNNRYMRLKGCIIRHLNGGY